MTLGALVHYMWHEGKGHLVFQEKIWNWRDVISEKYSTDAL